MNDDKLPDPKQKTPVIRISGVFNLTKLNNYTKQTFQVHSYGLSNIV